MSGELEKMMREHDDRLYQLEAGVKLVEQQTGTICNDINEIKNKVDRPSWAVTIIIVALSSATTGLLVASFFQSGGVPM